MKIEKKELLKVMSRLYDEIDLNFPKNINLNEDYYWNIESEYIFDVKKEPEMTIGQLTFDWEELSRLTSRSEESINYDLKRFAMILRYLEKESFAEWNSGKSVK
ncbi:hypothetical protein [Winogradskyella flava]|uniref:Uncharacterized protein n=1 Tax=Winogradskyella flava TaxID=1884876 RepID=A0A842IPC3_9FLAO|nr:hypothetical protein [Winogradskyella flava]MBC2844631.1 hypothetical protein [Winogradskyella flava]